MQMKITETDGRRFIHAVIDDKAREVRCGEHVVKIRDTGCPSCTLARRLAKDGYRDEFMAFFDAATGKLRYTLGRVGVVCWYRVAENPVLRWAKYNEPGEGTPVDASEVDGLPPPPAKVRIAARTVMDESVAAALQAAGA